MKIEIEIVDHSSQTYPTVGDYNVDENGVRHIRVSKMQNEDMEFLVAIHEMIEQHLVYKKGLTDKEITEFDIAFENDRESGLHSLEEEPGFDRDSPYYDEHYFATGIEMLVANKLGVNWDEYNETVNGL